MISLQISPDAFQDMIALFGREKAIEEMIAAYRLILNDAADAIEKRKS